MDTLVDMKLDKKKQISYRSTDDIVSKLDLAAATLAAERVTFGGSKLRTGHLVNAIALWVGEMSTEDLVEFARPKLAALEAYLGRIDDDDEQGPDPGEKRTGAGDETRKLVVTHVPIFGDRAEGGTESRTRRAARGKK